MESKVEVVLFDIGNVILRATHKITEAILWDLGVRPDKVALLFHQPAYGDFARGRITGEQFAEATRNALEAPWLTDVQIRVAHDAHIYMVDAEVVEILEELKQNDRLLGFVTTTNEWQTERERQLIDLAARFGTVVRSHEIGILKTHSRTWLAVSEELCFPADKASSVLFVDDSPANNAAAEAAGLQVSGYDPTPTKGVIALRERLEELKLLPYGGRNDPNPL